MRFDYQAHKEAERLAWEFLGRVWAPPHDLDAIDELMTEDYVITSGGKVIKGRSDFKVWVAEFHRVLPGATNHVLDVFANPTGERVVSRWVCTGRNNGLFGLPADGREVSFSGLAVWVVRDGRLAECWVERAGLELYLELSGRSEESPAEG
jgi:predicted ester cyclase